jgi:hypothetical protein
MSNKSREFHQISNQYADLLILEENALKLDLIHSVRIQSAIVLLKCELDSAAD